MPEALLIIGHGTRDVQGVRAARRLGRELAKRHGTRWSALAFLEFTRPTIDQAIDSLARRGADRIICQPVLLFAAGHVRRDIPRLVRRARRRWPGVEFRIGPALDGHRHLLELCELRWKQALRGQPVIANHHTLLLVVGRGSSDAEANRSLERLAKQLRVRYRVGGSVACFASLAEPRFETVLGKAVRGSSSQRVPRHGPVAQPRHAKYRRIAVQPYFLFDGVLVKRVRALARAIGQAHPGIEILVTQPLGVHRLLIEAILDRAIARVPVQ